MCGRFTLTTSLGAVALRFEIRTDLEEAGHVPRYNIAPAQTIIVIGDDGQRYLASKLEVQGKSSEDTEPSVGTAWRCNQCRRLTITGV